MLNVYSLKFKLITYKLR